MSKLLTLEQTKECLISAREQNDKDSLNLLVLCNQGLVRFHATRYITSGVPMEDLISAGNEGLVRAINKFNYKENDIEKFSTYISTVIKNEIIKEIKYNIKHKQVLSFEDSIQTKKEGYDKKIKDIIGTDENELVNKVIEKEKLQIIKEVLSCLTRKERKIIILRFGLDQKDKKTQKEVAEIINCETSYVSFKENIALVKMRHPRITRKIKDFIEK